jgi:hypothetical protein
MKLLQESLQLRMRTADFLLAARVARSGGLLQDEAVGEALVRKTPGGAVDPRRTRRDYAVT